MSAVDSFLAAKVETRKMRTSDCGSDSYIGFTKALYGDTKSAQNTTILEQWQKDFEHSNLQQMCSKQTDNTLPAKINDGYDDDMELIPLKEFSHLDRLLSNPTGGFQVDNFVGSEHVNDSDDDDACGYIPSGMLCSSPEIPFNEEEEMDGAACDGEGIDERRSAPADVETLHFSDDEYEEEEAPVPGVVSSAHGEELAALVEQMMAENSTASARLSGLAASLRGAGTGGERSLSPGPTRFYEEVLEFADEGPGDGGDPPREEAIASLGRLSRALRALVEEDLDRHYARPRPSVPPSEGVSGPAAIALCGLAAANFVSGDMDVAGFAQLLLTAGVQQDDCFVDLGCGSGNCLVAAALVAVAAGNPACRFARVVGIEMSAAKVLECATLATRLAELSLREGLDAPAVETVHGNFLVEDPGGGPPWWSSRGVVFACATCFTPSLMAQLFSRLLLLPAGSRVILLDQALPELLCSDAPAGQGEFRLVGESVCGASWGQGTARVYSKAVH